MTTMTPKTKSSEWCHECTVTLAARHRQLKTISVRVYIYPAPDWGPQIRKMSIAEAFRAAEQFIGYREPDLRVAEVDDSDGVTYHPGALPRVCAEVISSSGF